METSGKKFHKAADQYARYSSMAFQMMAICGVFAYGGVRLDRWLALKFPVFTVVLTIGGVFLALYSSLRDFLRKK